MKTNRLEEQDATPSHETNHHQKHFSLIIRAHIVYRQIRNKVRTVFEVASATSYSSRDPAYSHFSFTSTPHPARNFTPPIIVGHIIM